MAKWFYSPEKRGFFNDTIHTSLPEDVIEITEEEHRSIINEINNNNKMIVIVDGKITFEEVVFKTTIEQVRSKRDRLLRESDYTQMPDWPGNKEVWAKYRQKLRDLPRNISDLENIKWPEQPK